MSRSVPLTVIALAALLGAPTLDAACPPGNYVRWIADYCMAQASTDDEIAVSDCINRESKINFRSSCNAALHYKRKMCELAISRGQRTGTTQECVDDPSFIGRTVQNGGPGA